MPETMDCRRRWSLLFTPAFGAFLQMRNWEALGEPSKAVTSRIWVAVTLVVLVGLPSVLVFVITLRRS